MIKRYTLTLVILTFVMNVMSQKVVFVDQTKGDDANDGTTWELSKGTVDGALQIAENNTKIYVKTGFYQEKELEIPSGVTLIGGFDTTLTGVDISKKYFPGEKKGYTILDGQGEHRVATVKKDGRIEGCMIQSGFSQVKGGGLLLDGGTAVYCYIHYNSAANADLTGVGGGVYIQNNGALINCVVAFNEANNGPAVSGMLGSLTNNTITQNEAINCNTCGIFMDKRKTEESFYHTVKINNQCWFRENLRTIYKPDGTSAGTVTTYSTDPVLLRRYGRLYTWNVVMANSPASTDNPSNVQGLCPNGWHIPSVAEVEVMETFLSGNSDYWCNSLSANIGKSLAATSTWTATSTLCSPGNFQEDNNAAGFEAYPIFSTSCTRGTYAYFWTTSEKNSTFYISNGTLTLNYKTYNNSVPVRCVKN